MTRTCAVEGCDRPGVAARGYCSLHYQRWRRHGDPEGIASNPHGKRYFTPEEDAGLLDLPTEPNGWIEKGYLADFAIQHGRTADSCSHRRARLLQRLAAAEA